MEYSIDDLIRTICVTEVNVTKAWRESGSTTRSDCYFEDVEFGIKYNEDDELRASLMRDGVDVFHTEWNCTTVGVAALRIATMMISHYQFEYHDLMRDRPELLRSLIAVRASVEARIVSDVAHQVVGDQKPEDAPPSDVRAPSELVLEASRLLSALGPRTVEGRVLRSRRTQVGVIYATLIDEAGGELRLKLRGDRVPAIGDQIRVTGRLTAYVGTSELQLSGDSFEVI